MPQVQEKKSGSDMGVMSKHIYEIMLREITPQIEALQALYDRGVEQVAAAKAMADIKIMAISHSMQLGMAIASNMLGMVKREPGDISTATDESDNQGDV